MARRSRNNPALRAGRSALSFGANVRLNGKLWRRSRGLSQAVNSRTATCAREAKGAATSSFPSESERPAKPRSPQKSPLHSPRSAHVSPSPRPPALRGPRKHTLRSDSQTSGPRKRRDRQAHLQRTEKGRCIFSSHCSVRLMLRIMRNPRLRHITYKFLLGKRQGGGNGREREEEETLMSAVLSTRNPENKWTVLASEMMSPKNGTHSHTPLSEKNRYHV